MRFNPFKKNKNLSIDEPGQPEVPESRFDQTTQVSPSSRLCGETTIGRYCYIGNHCDITKTNIGNYVSIANSVSIGAGEHKLEAISTNAIFYSDPYEELTRGDCIIRDDAWIGVDAVIRRGVTIGIGAVVGANSFVNRDVPDFAIVVGSPAKFIRYRFEETARAMILESRWWEYDSVHASALIAELTRKIHHAPPP